MIPLQRLLSLTHRLSIIAESGRAINPTCNPSFATQRLPLCTHEVQQWIWERQNLPPDQCGAQQYLLGFFALLRFCYDPEPLTVPGRN